MTRLARFTVILLALACIGSVIAAPANSAEPDRTIPASRPGLKGIVGHWWYIDRYGSRLLDEYARLGVTNVRLAIDWLHIEAVQGERHFEKLDPIFDGFKERNIDVLPVIATMPPWATQNGGECFQNHLVCRLDHERVADFQITMSEIVARYPQVKTWEFWNEPEMWESMRDPAEYEFWYRAFYSAARDANPQARIGVGTLTGWDFVSRLTSDLPYDAVSVHSYTDHRSDPIETDKVAKLHNGMLSRGRDVPIWLTEYGWNSSWLDNRGRAEAIDWAFRWLTSTPYVELAHYHMLHDTEEYWECCFGLVGPAPDFKPKQPAYDRFRSYEVQR